VSNLFKEKPCQKTEKNQMPMSTNIRVSLYETL